MEIGALKEGYRVKLKQPANPILPQLAMRAIALGPSSSGKTNAIVTMLTDHRFYRGKFDRLFWCSPTATVDPALDVLRGYIETTDQDQEKYPTFHDKIDVTFLSARVEEARKVTEYLKNNKSKQHGYNTLLVLDDLADVKRGLPEIARFVDSLFVKARHWGVSVILSTQKLKLPLISPTVRVNITAMFVWRLRNSSDLTDGFLHEMQALVDKKKLEEAYRHAVSIPYNFMYINLLAKDVDSMFFSGFTEKFLMSETDG